MCASDNDDNVVLLENVRLEVMHIDVIYALWIEIQ